MRVRLEYSNGPPLGVGRLKYDPAVRTTRGIHVIWTTYGTWLPSDPRKPGHWSPLFDFYGRMKQASRRLNMPDAATYRHARMLIKESPKVLTDGEIETVAEVIGAHLAPGMPGAMWTICGAVIKPTHVHLLFGRMRDEIGQVVGRIKSRTSSVLLKGDRSRSRIWTAGYWKVFLFDGDALHAANQYIEAHNTRRGLPPVPFDWIKPPHLRTAP